ncbi:MAG: S9 family peptidase [Alphaproteobacteria bacterium]|nr:S9 family peptidase [Alphaproteobacteria bacterium]
MRLLGSVLVVASVMALSACATIDDMMPFGGTTGTTPDSATSTTPGLAIDRKTGYPPYAVMKGTVLIAPHGAKRTDYYFWLSEKRTAPVIRYLDEENKYAAEVMAPTADLQKRLRTDIRRHADAVEGTPPFKDGDYWYYERYAPGADFAVIARRKGTTAAAEEILLDGQAEGAKHEQFKVNHYGASPDGAIFAYAVDYAGDRWHKLVFRDMRTGLVLPDKIENVAADFAFADDNKTVFYLKLQAGTARSYRLMRHVLGSDPKTDKTIYDEKDEQFDLSLARSKGGRVLLLTSEQTNTTEVRVVDASKADGAWSVMRPRTKGVRYTVDEANGQYFVRTNFGAPDYRVMTAPVGAPAATWNDLVPHQAGVYIDSFELLGGYIALNEYTKGGARIRVRNIASGAERLVPFDNAAGYASSGDSFTFPNVRNTDPDAGALRYGYTSPFQPTIIYDFDLASGAKREVQRTKARGHDASAYVLERTFAPAADGKQIPVTIAYRRDKFDRGDNPLLVYGYGAYGSSNDPVFRPRWPSLLDNGFVLAFAHVRGGREMGQAWYEDGRLRNKKNTFTDFIAVAEHMVKAEYGDKKRIFAMGRSAGGLTVGAVANMRPDLFKGIVANVPFVDVVTTMLDESIPLTTFEYDEWGNPGDAGDYEYMLSYSPYDQVDKRAYPAMLVTAGYNDSQVGYFEPAKWVAKLRRTKTDRNVLLFRTNMVAGHAGDSGRFGPIEEDALIDAFLLDQAGLTGKAETVAEK